MHYQPYDHMPVVHFGFWQETLDLWHAQGKLTDDEYRSRWEGFGIDGRLDEKLGFDFNYQSVIGGATGLFPGFESKVIEETPDGFKKFLNSSGVIELHRGNAGSIPSEVGRLLNDRESFDEHYRHRLQFNEARVPKLSPETIAYIENYDKPIALHCGSLFGEIRNWLGVEGSAYLLADDEELFDEIINMVGDICYRTAQGILAQTDKFSHAHFWEDICFKNGPLIAPTVFREKVGPHYKRITELLKSHNIDIVSLDCDGMIDYLLPTWFENGVNTMFPIEVGTWEASIAPWREKYGRGLRGVGGMNKNVFALDYAAVDAELERLRPLVELGGYIPCPDHRIPPTAKIENVQYYCDKFRRMF